MDWKNRINGSPRPFNLVNMNLQQMGCISLDRFLSSNSDADFEDIHYIEAKPTVTELPLPLSQTSIPIEQSSDPADASLAESQSSAVKMQNVARLHQACQRAFGGSEGLKFDYIQENGSQSKQCILTITRSNGSVRSYRTEPTFTRKTDAKAYAANIAVEMGALEFIATGDSDALKQKKGLLLSPLDVVDPEPQEKEEVTIEPSVDDGAIRQIESCCIEWRAGAVKPFWVDYQESKSGKSFGVALRIQLTPYSSRVYSTDTVFGSAPEAKISCANLALQEGVLDYIKHGNGQTDPASLPAIAQDGRAPESPARPMSVLSLQAFYESLPQPFPEPVADKTASEINGPAWLNTLLQSARGARLKSKFIWVMDAIQGSHGCVLRLERPDAECKSYFVDPRFHKRADAKAAVCLLAMSQGIGNYIRRVASEVENKISEHARKLANQSIYPGIITEYHKIRPNEHPEYTFDKDGNAFGCTLTIDLSSSPKKPDLTTYTVKPEYRNKVDAKVAVATLAAERGIFELLRFRGAPLPPGYVPFWESHNGNPVSVSKKRKEPDTRDDGDSNGQKEKKPKLEPADGHHDFASNKGVRKKPPASGSSGLVPLGAPAQKAGRPGGQHQHGHRSVGHSGALNNPSHFGMTPSQLPHPSYPPAPGAQPGIGVVHTMHYTYQFPPQPIYGTPQHPSGATGQYMGATAYPQMQPPNVPFYPGYIQAYGTVPPAAPYNPYPHQHQHYQYVAPGRQPRSTHSNIPGPSQTGYSAGYDHPDRPKAMDMPLDYGDGSGGGAFGAQEPSHRKKAKKSKGKVKWEIGEPSRMSESLSAPATDAETVSSRDRSLTVESGQISPKSHFDSLKEFCAREKKPQPHFYREAIFGDTGTRYKVWMEMGSERLELPTTFENLDDGRERLSRQVLNRLRKAKETQVT